MGRRGCALSVVTGTLGAETTTCLHCGSRDVCRCRDSRSVHPEPPPTSRCVGSYIVLILVLVLWLSSSSFGSRHRHIRSRLGIRSSLPLPSLLPRRRRSLHLHQHPPPPMSIFDQLPLVSIGSRSVSLSPTPRRCLPLAQAVRGHREIVGQGTAPSQGL